MSRAIAFGPRHEVSSDGEVRQALGARILTQTLDTYGYRRVRIGRKMMKVHRLVCEAFHGPAPSDRHEVCHIDGDKGNNAADNLRWGTRKENTADSIRLGSFRRPAPRKGAAHHAAKLTAEQVTELRGMAGSRSQRSIARLFGISQTEVCHIIQGRKW